MFSKLAKSTKYIKNFKYQPLTYKVLNTPQTRNIYKNILEKSSSFSRNSRNFKNQNTIILFKPSQQYRQYQQSSSSTAYSNSNIIGFIGIAALIGGGYILLNTLNMPKVVDTSGGGYIATDNASSSGTVVTQQSIPEYVRKYLQNVYSYVLAGLGLTGVSAAVAFKSGVAERLLNANPMVATFGLIAGTVGSMILCQSIHPKNTVPKWASFVLFNAVMGVSLCTLGYHSPQVLFRAGIYTAGIFGALSFTAIKAREDKFLFLGGPLMAGLCVLVLSSFIGMFLPARFVTALTFIENLSLYGGLALFCAYILYDTQKLMQKAKNRKRYEAQYGKQLAPVDYMRESIGIYLDIINIFIRLVTILSGNNKK